MTNKKKILILGIGNAQSDLINLLKQKGHYVIGISYVREGAALHLVDEFAPIDIVDREKVFRFAHEKKVDLIYSVGSDIAMPTVAYVSKKLGLPTFVSVETAELMQNKTIFRAFLNENNICPIPFMKAQTPDELMSWTIFPAIVKPADSQGQRGISKINGNNDLEKAFILAKSFSKTNTVIIEKFIDGKEISLNGYMVGGFLKYAFISDRQTANNQSVGIVAGHYFPTLMPEKLQTKAARMAEQIAIQLNYINGPIYFQMIYTSDDVFIVEGTPRLDGCHIWRLIEHRYGINLLEMTIEHLLNNNLLCKEVSEPANRNDSICFFLQEPETVFIEDKIEKDLPGNSYFELYYKNNETVRQINGILEKVGYQIVSNKS